MKRIVLVAPGVAPPWTEGRKNFVRDLATMLPELGCEVEIIDGMQRRNETGANGKLAPARAWSALRSRLDRDPMDTLVALFPYGRLSGYIGAINRLFLRTARHTCDVRRVPHVSVFYSAAGVTLDALGRYAPALAVGREAPNVRPIHLCIPHADRTWKPSTTPKRALFLCGYQHTTRAELESVLNERGLRDLLRAGSTLVELGLRLTIAIPFLRDPRMRDRLAAEVARLCPSLEVEMDGATTPIDALCSHDLFVFPYRTEHAVFVPTSLLEAFSVGIPVVAADHPMFAALTRDAGKARCGLHTPGDADDLGRAVATVVSDFGAAVTRAARARVEIRETWTIRRSAEELLGTFAASPLARA